MNYKRKIAEVLNEYVDIDVEFIEKLIEIPTESQFGDYAFPCFQLSKMYRKSPNIIAEELKRKINREEFKKIENVGAYLNFFVDKSDFFKTILEEIVLKGEQYGDLKIGEGKTICIEHSSLKIAQSFNKEKFFAMVVGNSLYKLFKKQGYEVKRLNYIDDCEIRAGKIICGYMRWGNKERLEKDIIGELSRVYNKFYLETEKISELENEEKICFRALKEDDEEVKALWREFRRLSLKELEKIHNLLNIKLDLYNGQVLHNRVNNTIVNNLKEKGLLVESNGVNVVMLDKYNMPPCIILNSDGEEVDTTKTLSSIICSNKKFDFDKYLYVVSKSQSLKFRQMIKILELAGYEWVENCIYVDTGVVKFCDRDDLAEKDDVIILQKLIRKCEKRIIEIINGKNLKIKNIEEVSKKLAIGSIIFQYLKQSRKRNIILNCSEICSLEEGSALYVQYSYIKAKNILTTVKIDDGEADFTKLNSKEAFDLVKILSDFSLVSGNAAEKYEPMIVTMYCIEVAKAFNSFYNCDLSLYFKCGKIMKEQFILVKATCQILKNALDLIGIEVVQEI